MNKQTASKAQGGGCSFTPTPEGALEKLFKFGIFLVKCFLFDQLRYYYHRLLRRTLHRSVRCSAIVQQFTRIEKVLTSS